jgi:hypothetical protein
VTSTLIAGLLLSAGKLAAAAPPAPSILFAIPRETLQFAQFSVRSRIVIRIETRPPPPTPVPAITRWVEKKGPRCIKMADIQGSAVIVANSVDIALRGGDRVRMRFERSCPGLDYYSGFYVVPNKDGKICVSRDVVRDRAGGECSIDRFRKLVAKK